MITIDDDRNEVYNSDECWRTVYLLPVKVLACSDDHAISQAKELVSSDFDIYVDCVEYN